MIGPGQKTTAPEIPLERLRILEKLAQRLGYRFRRLELLDQALRHSSYTHETPGAGASSEQLEFLGDAVLSLAVSDLLLAAFPGEPEGALSRRRAALVNARTLAGVARDLDLGSSLLLGKGEARQAGQHKPSLLADALEAVLAAVYLDGGFAAARRLIRRWFTPRLVSSAGPARQDSKTALQELVQKRYKIPPTYRVVEESGPSHERRFLLEIRLGDEVLAQGEGLTKKEAAQAAARLALEVLSKDETSGEEGPGR